MWIITCHLPCASVEASSWFEWCGDFRGKSGRESDTKSNDAALPPRRVRFPTFISVDPGTAGSKIKNPAH